MICSAVKYVRSTKEKSNITIVVLRRRVRLIDKLSSYCFWWRAVTATGARRDLPYLSYPDDRTIQTLGRCQDELGWNVKIGAEILVGGLPVLCCQLVSICKRFSYST